MSNLRGCRGSCRNPRRCPEHLWFDTMYAGARYRMSANEFAVSRMELGRQRPIESMEEVCHWERLYIGEIQAGRDPRHVRKRRSTRDTAPKTVAAFLDAYLERLSLARRRRRHPHRPADARAREHLADAALPERDRRGTTEATGGELENKGRPLRLAAGG